MERADLARSFPQTTIIFNHVGGPLGFGPYKGKEAMPRTAAISPAASTKGAP
jgi:hypothetical protein